jgi:hypothetical protein
MTEESYMAAIANLTEAINVLNRPNEGMGCAWGLRRGQVGWFHVCRARNELERLRDDLIRHERHAEARS